MSFKDFVFLIKLLNPPLAYPFQFGTAPSYAMKHGSVNVQLPHRLDQPQGIIKFGLLLLFEK